MKKAFLPIYLFLLAISLIECKKDDPFEYPDNPGDTLAELITHVTRDLSSTEEWLQSTFDDGCDGLKPTVSVGGDNIVLFLVPDSMGCTQEAAVKTKFSSDEITNVELEELEFEFTYVKLDLNESSELWISWHYKNLELDIDLAPFLRAQQNPVSGVFSLSYTDGEPVFNLNGDVIEPDFSETASNIYSDTDSAEEQFFQARLFSEGTGEESRLQFKYLRITSFTVPEG